MILKTSYSFMKPPPSARLIRGHRSAQGLVGCWPFSANGGLQVLDLSGNGNDLTFYNSPVWTSGKYGSAILFDDGSSQYLGRATSIITGPPFTIVCGFTCDDQTLFQTLVWIGDTGGGVDYWALALHGHESNEVSAFARRSGFGVAKTSSGYTAGKHHQAVGIFAAANDRRVYIDGGSKGTNTTNLAPLSVDGMCIARNGDGSPDAYLSGIVDYVMIYNRVLSDSERAKLYWNPFCMFERKARTALMSGYAVPPVGNAGIMTTNAGIWGPTF